MGDATWARLDAYAAKLNVSTSALIRVACEAACDEWGIPRDLARLRPDVNEGATWTEPRHERDEPLPRRADEQDALPS